MPPRHAAKPQRFFGLGFSDVSASVADEANKVVVLADFDEFSLDLLSRRKNDNCSTPFRDLPEYIRLANCSDDRDAFGPPPAEPLLWRQAIVVFPPEEKV